MLLAEANQKDTYTSEKIYITFNIFDEINQNLGIFKEVMTEIKQYLLGFNLFKFLK